MSVILIAAGIAVGTPVALLSLAYLAAASAHRQQAFQDEEDARLWTRASARLQPIAPALVAATARHRRGPVPTACPALPKPSAKPRAGRPAKRRVAR